MLDRGLIGKYDKYSFYITTQNTQFISDICNKYGLVANTYQLNSGKIKISLSTKEQAEKKNDKIFKSNPRNDSSI
jgi:hypothetical protein